MDLGKQEFPPLPSKTAKQKRKPSKQNTARNLVKARSHEFATLTGLPDELLLQILEYLPPLSVFNPQLRSVVSLSRTCRRLHRVVMNTLYAEYNCFFTKTFPFLRTLMLEPVAAQMVQTVTFRYGPNMNLRDTYSRSLADRRTIKAGFRKLDLPNWKTWSANCSDDFCEQEMLYAAILMHTPNIAALKVWDGELDYQIPKWVDLIRHAVSRSNYGTMHRFPNLKSAFIDIRRLRLRNLASLFRLPSLRSLILKGLTETCQTVDGDPFPFKWSVTARSSPIEELILPESLLDTKILVALVDTCRSLKKIEYSHTTKRWAYSHRQRFPGWHDFSLESNYAFADLDYPLLAEALHKHSSTLHTVDIVEVFDEHIGFIKIPSPLHGLRELKNLSSLRATPYGLVGVGGIRTSHSALADALPRSLVQIELVFNEFGKEAEYIKMVEYVAMHCQEKFPLLREIRLQIDSRLVYHDGNEYAKLLKYDLKSLHSTARDHGLRFLINSEDGGLDKFIGPPTPVADSETESEEEEPLYSDEDDSRNDVALS